MQTIINKSFTKSTPSVFKYGKLFSKNKADSYFEAILEEIEDLAENNKGIMYGKSYVSELKSVQISNPNIALYNYNSSGSTKVYKWNVSPTIKKIKKKVEKILGVQFNLVLVNIYNPDAHLGYHSDDEHNIISNSVIASVSLGAERPFLLKNKKTGNVNKILLENGSLCTMEGSFQEKYKHSIPKRKNINGTRINLTFRQMKINY